MKKLLALTFALIMILSLVSCGGGKDDETETTPVIDATADEIASAILSKVKFTDDLAAIDSEVAAAVYSIADGVKVIAYCGSGALAEELVIVEDTKATVKTSFETYRDKQIGIFEKYNMDEVAKLNAAYIEVFGDYTVYCVSPDTSAVKEALSSLTK